MDMGRRVECGRPGGANLRNNGNGRSQQRSRRACLRCKLDRYRRKFLAVRWIWLRVNRACAIAERPLEVQRRAMDMGGRLEPMLSRIDLWNSGNTCARQR